jgi:rhomboid family protein
MRRRNTHPASSTARRATHARLVGLVAHFCPWPGGSWAMNPFGLLWLGGIVERRLGSAAFEAIVAAGATASGPAGMWPGPYVPTRGIVIGAAGVVVGLLTGGTHACLSRAIYASFRRRSATPKATTDLLHRGEGISFEPGVSFAGHLGFAGGALMASMFM